MRPVDVVWKIIVRRDAIKLRRRLILLGPTRTGSETDVRSTIVAVYHPFRIIWSDPEIVVVTVRHADGRKGSAAINGFMKSDVQNIDGVFILCIGVNSVVVPRALAYRSTLTDSLPGVTRIVRGKETAIFILDHCKEPIRVDGRDRDVHFAVKSGRKTPVSRYLYPSVAAVGRFE